MSSTDKEMGAAPGAAPGGRLRPDARAGLVLLACCAVAFAATFTFDSVPDTLIQGPGAAAFPRIVIGVIAGLSLILILRAGSNDEPVEPVHPMSAATAGAGILFMIVAPFLGVIGAIFLAMVGIGRLWGASRWIPLVVIAAVTVSVVYVLFVKFLHIPIPLGILDSLFG
jgi:putative tricarboxylic transport membrane protein